jgi:hypothetical protein
MKRPPALLISLAVLIVAGAPASCKEQVKTGAGICYKDMDAVFESCAPGLQGSPCQYAPEEYAEACQDGCVMSTCPEIHDCTKKQNPKWCGTSCTDMRGGLFWRNFLGAAIRCDRNEGWKKPGYRECRITDTERRCPELTGTPWAEQFPALQK